MNPVPKLNRSLRRGIIAVALILSILLIISALVKHSRREKLPEPVVFVADSTATSTAPDGEERDITSHEKKGGRKGKKRGGKKSKSAKKKGGKKSEKNTHASKPQTAPRNPLSDTIPTQR